MKISFFTHHFPPRYMAGAEQYAYRVVQELQRQGHQVEVICIESIQEGTLMPREDIDSYRGLLVRRLYINLEHAPSATEWSFRNPQLGYWAADYLLQAQPDLVHINGGYLISGSMVEVAQKLGFPVAVTLHDYWFICPLITLCRPNGQICTMPVSPEYCTWCNLLQKRRFRIPDRWLNGRLGDIATQLMQRKTFARLVGLEHEIILQAQRRLYLKNILETANLVITPSQFVGQKLDEYGICPQRLVHLPFGLDCDSHLLQLSGYQHASPALRMAYIGQLAEHKGVHLLIKAFRRLKYSAEGCSLVIYGNLDCNDPYYRKLRRLVGRSDDIVFAGPYPNSRVADILLDVNVVVVPSQWYENRPTVIVEAMARGVPVVGTNIGGIPELVHHNRDGLLFEKGDVNDLQRQLQRLIDDPALLTHLCQNILPVPDVRQEVSELVALYQSILEYQPLAINVPVDIYQ